jgi:hypothetical protein
MRVPLLPTLSHAFSQSLYSNAQSASLKTKLEKLLSRASKQSEAGNEVDLLISEAISATPDARFEELSASIWNVLQQQLRRPDRAQRLSPWTYHPDALTRSTDIDLPLFGRSFPQHLGYGLVVHEGMEEEGEEEMEEKGWFENESEYFDHVRSKSCYLSEDEDDLYGDIEENPVLDGELMSNSSPEAYLEREGQHGGDNSTHWPEAEEQTGWEDEDDLLLDHLAVDWPHQMLSDLGREDSLDGDALTVLPRASYVRMN